MRRKKQNKRCPEIEITGIPGMTAPGIKATIQAVTGVEPKKVEDQGNATFVVKVRNLVDRDKVMDLHGRTVAGTGRALVAKTLRKEIPYEEVFTLLRTKLATRERVDAMQRNREIGQFDKPQPES